MYISINPANKEQLADYPLDSNSDLSGKLERASVAQQKWEKEPLDNRLKLIESIKSVYLNNKEMIARNISLEMGKLYSEALAEVNNPCRMCDFLLENAKESLKEQKINFPDKDCIISKEAQGLVYCITPWNYPFWIPNRALLPALAAGNAFLLKPAPNVTGCAMLIKELVSEAGLDPDLFQVLLTDNQQATDLIETPEISSVVFTGSVPTGSHLGAKAGSSIKKITMELGGSDPLIILPDCDLKNTAKIVASARTKNAGQICCSPKRIIIAESIVDTFLPLLIAEFESKQPGDPFDESANLGPLAREDLYIKAHDQLRIAVEHGAKVLTKDSQCIDSGYYFKPVIIENISKNSPVYDQEFFSPVGIIHKFSNTTKAIELANDTQFGLGANIFTSDPDQAIQLAKGLKCGSVSINSIVGGDPYLPFGGYKKSGIGRESGVEGLLEYTQTKVVSIPKA